MNDVLARNLQSFARTSPDTARLLEHVPPHSRLEIVPTDDGCPSAVLDGVALASRRRPLAEAKRLVETVDMDQHAFVVVIGFGMGYHVAELARQMGPMSLVLVFEPDVSLLRSVLETVDHSEAFACTNLVIMTQSDNAGVLAASIRGMEMFIALGITILEHPPSRARLGPAIDQISGVFTQMVSATRANLVTGLVMTEKTISNQIMNLGHYSTVGGIEDLRGWAS